MDKVVRRKKAYEVKQVFFISKKMGEKKTTTKVRKRKKYE